MRPLLVVAMLFLGAVPAAAQLAAPGPPGPWAIDLHGATLPVPEDQSFFPPVPPGTIAPLRGFGLVGGAHVYLIQLGAARLGVGASVLRSWATASAPEPDEEDADEPRTIPDVASVITLVAPQVSVNFGTADGWSYVSAGYGTAQVDTSTAGLPSSVRRSTGAIPTINVGGGARWFRGRHLGVSFDIRVHLVAARQQAEPLVSPPRATLISASVGISLR